MATVDVGGNIQAVDTPLSIPLFERLVKLPMNWPSEMPYPL
jgi:hypothetical protein